MIDPFTTLAGLPNAAEAKPHKVLRMVTNERTAGSIPMWVNEDQAPESSSSIIEASFNENQNTGTYALRGPDVPTNTNTETEFGFADLIDMVNPLQHIPVVNHFYREMTGDEIRPISQIIGGGVFGGPLGAASGLANVIAIQETGDDLTGNALAMLGGKSKAETPMRYAAKAPIANDDLAGALLAFSDLKSDPQILIARLSAADDDQKLA